VRFCFHANKNSRNTYIWAQLLSWWKYRLPGLFCIQRSYTSDVGIILRILAWGADIFVRMVDAIDRIFTNIISHDEIKGKEDGFETRFLNRVNKGYEAPQTKKCDEACVLIICWCVQADELARMDVTENSQKDAPNFFGIEHPNRSMISKLVDIR
jgi:hypothetical protein